MNPEEFNQLPKQEKVEILKKGFAQLLEEQRRQNDAEVKANAEMLQQRLQNSKDERSEQKRLQYEKELPEKLKWLTEEKEKIVKKYEPEIKEIEEIKIPLLREKSLNNTRLMIDMRLAAIDLQYKTWLSQFE